MQKPIALALVVGAVVIAAALIYHGQQLARLSSRLDAVQKSNVDLNQRLAEFSQELPGLIGQGGRDAGRQAVHGAVAEVIETPLNWVSPKLVQGGSNMLQRLATAVDTATGTNNPGGALIRFDISEPIVNVRILPGLKELPDWPWLSSAKKEPPTSATNQDDALPEPAEEPAEEPAKPE